jgi:hypothetical protein
MDYARARMTDCLYLIEVWPSNDVVAYGLNVTLAKPCSLTQNALRPTRSLKMCREEEKRCLWNLGLYFRVEFLCSSALLRHELVSTLTLGLRMVMVIITTINHGYGLNNES